MIPSGAVVIVHLANPVEQHWGVLEELGPAGVVFRGINVASFEDFLAQATRNEEHILGFSTMFVPMFRVERIFLDQTVGAVESYQRRFLERTGSTLEAYLGTAIVSDDTPPS
ncbi:MAG: hypothetical protein R3190_10735 [Thermoanaerobaculia bacterium]|nr:hypothetical protein [Thermoanaerobaculia bacterium]